MSHPLFTSDVIMIISPFKIHDFRLSAQWADDQLVGKSLLHMQTLGNHYKQISKSVIIRDIIRGLGNH